MGTVSDIRRMSLPPAVPPLRGGRGGKAWVGMARRQHDWPGWEKLIKRLRSCVKLASENPLRVVVILSASC